MLKYSFEGFDQFATATALAEVQITQALTFGYTPPFNTSNQPKINLSEMRHQFSNAGENFTHLNKMRLEKI